jgi:hypothetical protein
MQKCCVIFFGLADALTSASAQSANTSDRARYTVTESAEAIGGLDRLRAISAIRFVEQVLEYLVRVGDPRLPHGMVIESVTSLRRESPLALGRTTRFLDGRPFDQTVAATDSVVSTATVYDRETGDTELSMSPGRVLLTALDAPDLHTVGDSAFGAC